MNSLKPLAVALLAAVTLASASLADAAPPRCDDPYDPDCDYVTSNALSHDDAGTMEVDAGVIRE